MPPAKVPPSADLLVQDQLRESAEAVEGSFDADLLTYCGPIQSPADKLIRRAIEFRKSAKPKRRRLLVVLTTSGGYIETAERIADVFRKHYAWVGFAVLDQAMSAGTVLVMSGDEIYMDYFSRLGPIDPQVQRADGKRGLIPALGYLIQYERLIKKSGNGTLTSGEAAILVQNFDLGELYYYEQARSLSIKLLKQWLVKYKFKNWKETEKRRAKVTPKIKRDRAEEIARKLNDTDLWGSHSRGISMEVLKRKVNLRVKDIAQDPKQSDILNHYYGLLTNYMGTISTQGAIHTGPFFLPLR